MKKTFIPILMLLIITFTNLANAAEPVYYGLVYHQNSSSEPVSGSKKALESAIRHGKKIRLYMNLGFVEHAMDAGFLSIFEGEVYAQIDHIKGQRPNKNSGEIELLERTHIGFYSTKSPYEIKWFVVD